jgi:hemin uptake protein HemP
MSDAQTSAPTPSTPPPVILSEALFGARRELIIRHGAAEYRLRITKTDKLILTK